MAKSALIVVDVQRDFCQGGALAARDTLSLLKPLQECIESARQFGAVIVFTQDWHPAEHSSFTTTGGPWPVHCVANTPGAELMPPVSASKADVIIHKGVKADGPGYSGFELTGLGKELKERGVERIGVSGIATEYCVRATALDALYEGFDVTVLTDLIRAVEPSAARRVLTELRQRGAKTSLSAEWLNSLKD